MLKLLLPAPCCPAILTSNLDSQQLITQGKGYSRNLSETVLNHPLPCHLVFSPLKILLFFPKKSKLKCIVNVFQMNYDSISSRG